jgi:deoxyribodipyrimidine photo-lyase
MVRRATLGGVTASPRTVMWFRRDLRVDDHPALAAAAARGEVVALWVADPALLTAPHHRAPVRLRFLRACLEALDTQLRDLGIGLVVRDGDPAQVVPAVAAEAGADRVVVTDDVTPYSRRRDAAVAHALASAGVAFEAIGGPWRVPLDDLAGSSGNGYLVFTPFFKAWDQVPVNPRIAPPAALEGPDIPSDGLGALPAGDPLIAAGPAAARARLEAFIRSGHADAYADGRDDLAADATSHLSADLRMGVLSPAQVGRAIGAGDGPPAARQAFWRQLAWRDFYAHHMQRHPVVAGAALKEHFRAIEWDDAPELLEAWREGRTGFPLVDAGMRQMAATGWMHNRARMVCASVLVKDLLLDWRRGEAVFMRGLLDGDPANNNGGWQWTAGTGTDAAPYFRVFNPFLQAKRFDPTGAYVRRWVPELAEVPDRYIHEPWTMPQAEQDASGCHIGTDYPAPIVDHATRRVEAIERYKAAGGRYEEAA